MKIRPWIAVPLVMGLAGAAIYIPEIESARDFQAYRSAADLLHSNGEIYETGYIYPPTFAWLFSPIGRLSPRLGAIVWYALNVALLTSSLWMTSRLVGLRGAWAAAPLLFTFRFVNNTLRSGQVNILILFLVCLSGYLFARRGKLGSGLSLALASVIKVTPALLIVYHGLRGRWRVAAAGIAGGLLLLAVPAVTAGTGRTADLISQWRSFAFAPYLSPRSPTPFEDPETGYIPGQSIRALVHRLLRPIDATPHDERIVHVNIASVRRAEAEAIYLIVTALVLGVFVWSLGVRGRKSRPGPSDDGDDRAGEDKGGLRWKRFSQEYALAILFIFLLSPYIRKGHGTLLLIPYAVVIAACKDPLGTRSSRRWTILSLATSFCLSSLTGRFVLGVEGSQIASALCPFLWGNVVLFLWSLISLSKGKPQEDGRPEEGPLGLVVPPREAEDPER